MNSQIPSIEKLRKWLEVKWYILGILFCGIFSYVLAGVGIGSGKFTGELIASWIALGFPILIIFFYEPTVSHPSTLMGRWYTKAIYNSYQRTAHLGFHKAVSRIIALPFLLILVIGCSHLFITEYIDKWSYGILIGIGISKLAQYGAEEEIGSPKGVKDKFSIIIIPLIFILFLVPYIKAEYNPDLKEAEVYKVVELGFIILLPLVTAGLLALISIGWNKLIKRFI